MRRLLWPGVVLAGLAYVGRQYGREISLLFGTSSGAGSRAERPNAGARRNLERFNGCGMEGDARGLGVRTLDRLKNRYTQPRPEPIDSRITLAAILAPGNDIGRWKVKEGAEITGYVCLFDAEHQRESENTAPERAGNWRATAWGFIRRPRWR